jgi:3-oxoacyl-[acyl-carrier protein] reductase
VVFSYHRDREAATQVEIEARKHGTRIESIKADIGKPADAQKLVKFAVERLGRVDILIANAGIYNGQEAPIEKLTDNEWDEMARVNLKGVYTVVHEIAPHMIAQKSGKARRFILITPQRRAASSVS